MPKRLLPLIPPGLAVTQVPPSPDCITILASPQGRTAACPRCRHLSHRVHSRYERQLGDLAWQGRPVLLRVRARRFRCLHPACQQLTFIERLPGIAAVAARRTERLGSPHCCLGLALGGEAAARLATRLAVPTSPDTLLRAARLACGPARSGSAPRVLGVDDWAWRKGHRYGTILVDLERNAVVDLLPDRQADTLAGWLQQHPGVEIVARDRAGAFADGIRHGAPDAVQVTDRWHVLRNLGGAMQDIVGRPHAVAGRVGREMTASASKARSLAQVTTLPTVARQKDTDSYHARLTQFEEARRLQAAGASLSAISRQLGRDRKTLRGWLRADTVPPWCQPLRGSILDAFRDHLERRWAEGCRNAARLWRELTALGYQGRYSVVHTWAATRRQAGDDGSSAAKAAKGQPWRPPTGRKLARLVTAEADKMAKTERQFVAQLLAEVPALAAAAAVARRLALLLRRRSDEALGDVLAAADGTLLASFAAELRKDEDAVQAALDTPWTTSPVEGQISRLKMLKRSMYGRAGFDLLRARVLAA